MARVHEDYIPFHSYLMIDLLEDGEDRMSVWERRTIKSSSSGKTTEDKHSVRDISPSKEQGQSNMKTPIKSSGKGDSRVMNTQDLMMDNPVITQGSHGTIYQSDINLSVFNETSPFKLSDIQVEMTEEERKLRQQLAIMEAKRGAKAPQPSISYAMMQQSANQTIQIWRYRLKELL